jgi:hypothetical protein
MGNTTLRGFAVTYLVVAATAACGGESPSAPSTSDGSRQPPFGLPTPTRTSPSKPPSSLAADDLIGVVRSHLNTTYCPGGANGGWLVPQPDSNDIQTMGFAGLCFNGGDDVWVWLIDADGSSPEYPNGVIGATTVQAYPDDLVIPPYGPFPGLILGSFSPVCSRFGHAYLVAWDLAGGVTAQSGTFNMCAF